jgi:Core-2/I-Branching enzyme/LicD family
MGKKLSEKSKQFNSVLLKAKKALDSVGVPFHLHSGTALGAHREKDFIPHDDDIDLAVFYKDVDTKSQVDNIIKAMEDNGLAISSTLGKLSRGFELKFYDYEYEIPLDIFWVYESSYRGKDYFILSSYYGNCDNYKHKACVWAYRPYKTVKINFLGSIYNVMPKKTLVDAYGKDWNVPKKFGYYEGLENGYKSLVVDFYDPKPITQKVAFCFLVYDKVTHGKTWADFFKEDNLPVKSYSIYSHVKTVTSATQPWLVENRIRTIKTGWCEDNLVWAWINMLKEALKDPLNQYFTILSGECIPLYGFWETIKKITSSKKSRINIDKNASVTYDTGLAYADQWVLLTRKHAEMLVKLKDSDEGKNFVKEMRQRIQIYCPDEVYPVNWFIKQYGSPSSATFKKNFNVIPTTYTFWDGKQPHPIKYTTPRMRKDFKKICGSDAIFARKFNNKAGKELARTCPIIKSKPETSKPKTSKKSVRYSKK